MSTFSNEEKVQILSDIVAIETVNDNELEVCNYLQKLFSNYGIESKIQKLMNDVLTSLLKSVKAIR